jgi:hypothetical protein
MLGHGGHVIDWMLKDRQTGRRVVVQPPNAPLLIWFAVTLLRWAWHPDGTAAKVLDVVGTTALVLWAVDEVARGVNPFRRGLGAVVLLLLAARWLLN